jgi:hypothetical protein
MMIGVVRMMWMMGGGDNDENDDCGPVDGPTVLNHVMLATSRGKYWHLLFIYIGTHCIYQLVDTHEIFIILLLKSKTAISFC